MKKLLGIVVIGLLLSGNAYAREDIYIRCIPEVQTVREGDLKKGEILRHRIMYFRFKNEIDLTKSEKPRRILKKRKIYLVNSKGKKDRLRYPPATYTPTIDTMSIDFEKSNYSETQKYLSTMNVNYDGLSWVASGNYNNTKVEGNKLLKDNFSWFAKCYEITKKDFKKPVPNQKFFDNVSKN